MSPIQQDRLCTGISLALLLVALIALAGCTGPSAPPSGQSSFDNDLSKITADPRYTHASWGLIIVDPVTGTSLYEKNADEMFVPGSTTKLFSGSAVIEALGADHRFVTPVYATAGTDTSGTMNGDLILVATGDLTMGGRTLPDGTIAYTDIDHGDANALGGAILAPTDPVAGLDELASKVKASGITGVSDVIVDDRLFAWNDPEKDFVISPIMVNDNLVDITITPGSPGTAASLAMRPETAAYRLENRVTTGPAGTPLALGITESPAGTIRVSGTIAASAGPVNQTYSVQTPAAFARTLFIEALEREGVAVTADTIGDNPAARLPAAGGYAGTRMVANLTSPPLIEDVKLTLKVSQNMHADTYIMLVAAASGKTGFSEGMQEEGKILKNLGLDTGSISLADGEGGDSADLFSPQSAAQLLTIMTTRPYAERYVHALPVLGVDGSLASSCTAGNPACGHVYAKTGTRAGYNPLKDEGILFTKSLAGYVDTKGGKRLVFAVFVNNVPYSDVKDMMTVGDDLGSIAGLIYTHY
ncbi:MAG: D-alanyl-D-alanine carboxypeptidase/D-alanyl-D-alanine-endopeptidase [Methanoregula sp.]|nr:D-alanyl-D-alanine carboxypeptidase/D-alanyl-D-alanine-endopeptidase [Methanoregula sp.]